MVHLSDIECMITRTCDVNNLKITIDGPVTLVKNDALKLYDVHTGKWFHGPMAEQVSDCDLYAFIIEGKCATGVIRRLVGLTNPVEAQRLTPGTIRGQFAEGDMEALAKKKKVIDNCVHASRNVRDAKHEIAIVQPKISRI